MHPICRKPKKWLPWHCPFVAVYWQYLYFVGQPLKSLSITNGLVAIVHTKLVTTILVPKLVAMAMTLRHSISAMSSRIAWPKKPTSRIEQRIASYHIIKVIAH